MTALLEYSGPDCPIRVSRSFLANSVPKKWGDHGPLAPPGVSTAYDHAHLREGTYSPELTYPFSVEIAGKLGVMPLTLRHEWRDEWGSW